MQIETEKENKKANEAGADCGLVALETAGAHSQLQPTSATDDSHFLEVLRSELPCDVCLLTFHSFCLIYTKWNTDSSNWKQTRKFKCTKTGCKGTRFGRNGQSVRYTHKVCCCREVDCCESHCEGGSDGADTRTSENQSGPLESALTRESGRLQAALADRALLSAADGTRGGNRPLQSY